MRLEEERHCESKEKKTVRVKCPSQEHNIMFLIRAWSQTSQSRRKSTNHKATVVTYILGITKKMSAKHWFNYCVIFLCSQRNKNEAKWRPFMSLGIKLITVGGLLSNCLVTALLLLISHSNYPGGLALQRLHKLLDNHTGIMVNDLFRLSVPVDTQSVSRRQKL